MDVNLNLVSKDNVVEMCQQETSLFLDKGVLFLSQVNNYEQKDDCVSTKEYALNSTLHRGYYNPSPIYDVIVGNTKRGKISVKPHAANVTHIYYFNGAHELIKIESIFQNRVAYSEFLFHEDNTVYGFTIDCNNRLAAVSRELYVEDTIRSFTLVRCAYNGRDYQSLEYVKEEYQYDTVGLFRCRFIDLVTGSGYLTNKVYEFSRQGGMLVSYAEVLGEKNTDSKSYLIKKQRKA